jgi:hypothetical protein
VRVGQGGTVGRDTPRINSGKPRRGDRLMTKPECGVLVSSAVSPLARMRIQCAFSSAGKHSAHAITPPPHNCEAMPTYRRRRNRFRPHELDELQGRMVSAMQWTALSFGSLLLLSQAQEPTQEGKLIHLAEISCKTFTEFTQQEQAIIISWLQGYNLPEKAPAVIDLEKLSSDKAKLTEHCTEKPDDDVMTAAEAVMGQ